MERGDIHSPLSLCLSFLQAVSLSTHPPGHRNQFCEFCQTLMLYTNNFKCYTLFVGQ
nr:MAG TPA: hypothetical protein [Caudoviricetes sp.]